jgi:hypothetical protein
MSLCHKFAPFYVQNVVQNTVSILTPSSTFFAGCEIELMTIRRNAHLEEVGRAERILVYGEVRVSGRRRSAAAGTAAQAHRAERAIYDTAADFVPCRSRRR